jgi:hypothetical protein
MEAILIGKQEHVDTGLTWRNMYVRHGTQTLPAAVEIRALNSAPRVFRVLLFFFIVLKFITVGNLSLRFNPN